jgi:hypothetical protein
MAAGCLGLLFGLKRPSNQQSKITDQDMGEGDIHSGPGGYEGPSYSGGYAANYVANLFDEDEDEDRQ